jgi:hypothetical protein
MNHQVCPFHTDESYPGTRLKDGSISFECDRASGHPGNQPWFWLAAPEPPSMPELSGLAEELGLEYELPAAVADLGDGWFEYGLVERSYAKRRPADFAHMVERWGHTAIAPKQYTVSSYVAATLGRLSRRGAIAYHPGAGTGRWSYNSEISWWSTVPPGDWDKRTSWVEVIGDYGEHAQTADLACKSYVPGA